MLSRALPDTKLKSGSVTTKPHCTGLIFSAVLNSFPQSSFCRSPPVVLVKGSTQSEGQNCIPSAKNIACCVSAVAFGLEWEIGTDHSWSGWSSLPCKANLGSPYLSLGIIVFSAFTGLIPEGLCWWRVYPTASSRRLEQEIEKASRKVAEVRREGQENKTGATQRWPHESIPREIFKIQVQTSVIEIDLLASLSIYSLNCETFPNLFNDDVLCSFDGILVAKRPFEPPGFLTRATHRNLIGEDYTDCLRGGTIF